jgi:hypothetical protein
MTDSAESKLDVMRLRPEDAARLLGVGQEVIEQDVADGLPTNADGTISLVSYAAWLNLLIGEDEDAGA